MQIEILPLHKDVRLPEYATDGSAGCDLYAHNFKRVYEAGNEGFTECKKEIEIVGLPPGGRVLVGLGFKVAIPFGREMQIRPRSGKALKEGLTVLNSPGTIDSDYRGEVGVILINHGRDIVVLTKGDAIAQGVIVEVEQAKWKVVKELQDTVRGEGGYGSTTTKQS